MLPDFIIIGAMKSGTTSLYHYLKIHPQIGMSRLKETDFFIKEKNLTKGLGWYESLFKGNFSKYGEASPNYSKAHFFGGVPEEMHKLLPDAKLIYLVRDPVKRIISHYGHNYAAGRASFNMEETLSNKQKFNDYLFCSKYYWQLQQYLDYFPKEQILIVSSSKLKTHRKQTLKKIFSFLEVDDTFYSEEYEREFGKSSDMTKKGKISQFILKKSFMNTVRAYMPDDFKYRLKKMILPTVEKKPKITHDLKIKFEKHLKDDVKKLRAYTGESYSEWSV